jgi:predicted small lipoprotein YifL
MRSVVSAMGFLVLVGCGVKGDPLPPEDAPKLGRGTPTYSRAVDDLEIEKQKIVIEPEDGEKEEQNEEL